jgi:hypothetical protein
MQLPDSGETIPMRMCRLYWLTLQDPEDSEQVKAAARSSFQRLLPHFWRLMEGYDASLRDRKGEHALHVMCSHLVPKVSTCWTYKLAELLLQKGVDPNQPDADGCPPLVRWAGFRTIKSACGLQLLIRCGADIHATNKQGQTMMHSLIQNKKLSIIEQLLEGGLEWLDCFQPDKKGETIIALAEKAVQERPNDQDSKEIKQMVKVHAQTWRKHVRPLLHSALSHSLLLPELAAMVVDYLDGGGRPFQPQRQDDEEEK